jgi:NAD(P)-dependent dehydrogenase (short-subunit alcohol dehydrogenase family)
MQEITQNPSSNRSVIITGSSRGIGLAIARAFLDAGENVVISGIDADEVENARRSLSDIFGTERVESLTGDVARGDYASALVEKALSRFGRLDTVVCNAGIDVIKPAIDYTETEWDRVLAINLRGAFLPAQAAARYWIKDGLTGSIIMTSSIASRCGVAGLTPYGASKGGIDQLVRNLAVEWAASGIRVNAVTPGYVNNIMSGVTVHADPKSEERIKTFTPLGRRAEVQEIAVPFVFLASEAASYITGAILPVDGGYSAQ